MENKYELTTGVLECYPQYAIFHFNADFYDLEEAFEFSRVIDSHYGSRKCVIVSTREMAKHVNPEVYSRVKSKCVVGIAIVSSSESVKREAVEEQLHYDGAFSYFRTLEEAIDWSKTVVD